MPEYCYVCPECGLHRNIVKPMSEYDKLERCNGFGGCKAILDRNLAAEAKYSSGDRYGKPLISDSLAMHPSQIAEHNKLFPDIKVHKDGRPQFDNFKQHDDYLEKTGFVKCTQRKKRRGKIIKST
ncbi:hypothetical protein LCGC14_0415570 [marine sediment metagenome]|uniref:Uncharacterized protein n=1 Tax=marine sediment metagenome TaxID=412755 RepID=A0A0F9VEC4_9ZZZZ